MKACSIALNVRVRLRLLPFKRPQIYEFHITVNLSFCGVGALVFTSSPIMEPVL